MVLRKIIIHFKVESAVQLNQRIGLNTFAKPCVTAFWLSNIQSYQNSHIHNDFVANIKLSNIVILRILLK